MVRHGWILKILQAVSRDKKRFETDPKLQLKIHTVFTYVWLCNMVAASTVFFLFPHLWAMASVFYLVLISLYSNFATDYGAVSSALAADKELEQ